MGASRFCREPTRWPTGVNISDSGSELVSRRKESDHKSNLNSYSYCLLGFAQCTDYVIDEAFFMRTLYELLYAYRQQRCSRRSIAGVARERPISRPGAHLQSIAFGHIS